MSDVPSRMSAESINQALINAGKRLKTMVDHDCEMLSASGYPPLTDPVSQRTLRDLNENEAGGLIQQHLQQTQGAPGAVELAVKYIEDQRKAAEGG